ncbi:MAG: hypothetical protein ACLS2X_09400 [Coprococcus sp.]|jgi:DNA-directed RNA polymerase subunit RPC12/RpoP
MNENRQLLYDLKNVMKEAEKPDNKDAVFVSIPLKNMQTIINALELQIPVKPELRADGCADGELAYDEWVCPRCGAAYELEYDEYACCPNCGQKIAWEELK